VRSVPEDARLHAEACVASVGLSHETAPPLPTVSEVLSLAAEAEIKCVFLDCMCLAS